MSENVPDIDIDQMSYALWDALDIDHPCRADIYAGVRAVCDARDQQWRAWCASQDSSLAALQDRIAALEAALARAEAHLRTMEARYRQAANEGVPCAGIAASEIGVALTWFDDLHHTPTSAGAES